MPIFQRCYLRGPELSLLFFQRGYLRGPKLSMPIFRKALPPRTEVVHATLCPKEHFTIPPPPHLQNLLSESAPHPLLHYLSLPTPSTTLCLKVLSPSPLPHPTYYLGGPFPLKTPLPRSKGVPRGPSISGIRVAQDAPGDMRGPGAESGPDGCSGPDSYREHTNKQTNKHCPLYSRFVLFRAMA